MSAKVIVNKSGQNVPVSDDDRVNVCKGINSDSNTDLDIEAGAGGVVNVGHFCLKPDKNFKGHHGVITLNPDGTYVGDCATPANKVQNLTAANWSAAMAGGGLPAEIAARIAGDAALQTQITAASGDIDAHLEDLDNPHSTTAAQIGAPTTAVFEAEVLARSTQDGILATADTTEHDARIAADSAEYDARIAADNALRDRIAAEETARAARDELLNNADIALSGRIDTANTRIDGISSAISDEVSARNAADNSIRSDFAAADSDLQDQIDDILADDATDDATVAGLGTRLTTAESNITANKSGMVKNVVPVAPAAVVNKEMLTSASGIDGTVNFAISDVRIVPGTLQVTIEGGPYGWGTLHDEPSSEVIGILKGDDGIAYGRIRYGMQTVGLCPLGSTAGKKVYASYQCLPILEPRLSTYDPSTSTWVNLRKSASTEPTTIYVSPAGLDSNDGSATAHLRTLQEAVYRLPHLIDFPTRIKMLAGTYNDIVHGGGVEVQSILMLEGELQPIPKNSAGTISSFGTSVTGVGTNFTSALVGGQIVANWQTRTVTAVADTTHLTVSVNTL